MFSWVESMTVTAVGYDSGLNHIMLKPLTWKRCRERFYPNYFNQISVPKNGNTFATWESPETQEDVLNLDISM